MGTDSHAGKNWMAAENTKGKRNIAQKVFCRGVLIIFCLSNQSGHSVAVRI
jgi:hypothetical protein